MKRVTLFIIISIFLIIPVSAEMVYKQRKDGTGYWAQKTETVIREYDSNNNVVYEREYGIESKYVDGKDEFSGIFFGRELWSTYDSTGKLLYKKVRNNNGDIYYKLNDYDSERKLIYSEDSGPKWYKYDSKGILKSIEVYHADEDGFYLSIEEYNQEGKLVQKTNNFGGAGVLKYDKNGNIIYEKNSVGKETWYKHDAKGNKIYQKDSDGNETWYTYNSKGELITLKRSDGVENKYAPNEQLISSINKDGKEIKNKCEFDSEGNVIYLKDQTGSECWYDSNGNIIHNKYSYGKESWYEYDAAGNKIYEKNEEGKEFWWKYNSNKQLIYYKTSYEPEKTWKYDSKGNLIHYTEISILYESNDPDSHIEYPKDLKMKKKTDHIYNYEYGPDGAVSKIKEYTYSQLF